MDLEDGEVSKWQPLLTLWEESLLAEIFGVSIHPKVALVKDAHFLKDLAGELKDDPNCSHWTLLAPGLLDRMVLASVSLSVQRGEDPSTFLLNVYGIAAQEARNTPSSRSENREARTKILDSMCQTLITYIVLTCPDPTMWGSSKISEDPQPYAGFIQSLKESKLHAGLLDHLLAHLKENDEIESFFGPVFNILHEELKAGLPEACAMREMKGFLSTINSVGILTTNKLLCGVLISQPFWYSEEAILNGQQLETNSFLGTMFSVEPSRKCFQQGAGVPEKEDLVARAKAWGSRLEHDSEDSDDSTDNSSSDSLVSPTEAEKRALDDCFKTARTQMQTLHMALHQVLRNLLKDKVAQGPTLQWLGRASALNTDRAKTGVQHGLQEAKTSSAGFMYNLTAVLLLMCEPFLNLADPKAEKMVKKIDLEYFLDNARFSIAGETRLSLAPEDSEQNGEAVIGSDRWLDQRNLARIQQFKQRQEALLRSAFSDSKRMENEEETKQDSNAGGPKQYGTITEYFGLTTRILFYGPIQTIQQMQKDERSIKDLKQQRRHLKDMLQDPNFNPMQRPQIEHALKQADSELDKKVLFGLSAKLTMMHPDFVLPTLQLLRLQAHLLLREVCSDEQRDGRLAVRLPLACPPPPVFAALPAHLVETLPEFLLFVTYRCPPHPRTRNCMLMEATHQELHEILAFSVSFIGSAVHLRNPYQRAKLVESLQCLCPETYTQEEKKLHILFEAHNLAAEHLAPLLLRFFVDIEFTGSHTQFYDKFNYRSITARLLKYLWNLPNYQESVIRYSEDKASFVRFANMMVNDSIYHMDESLKHLIEIKKMENDMENTDVWNSKTAEEKEQVQRIFEQTKQQVRYSLREANQLLQMMNYMSEKIVAPFMVEEMINRIAEMLNYFLDYLVGPKSLQLKVKNMDQLDWKPLDVLTLLIGVYCNFQHRLDFAEAVARDVRSYNRQHFLKAIEILSRPQLSSFQAVSSNTLAGFKEFADRAEECAIRISHEEEEFGEDVPEEFLCPISCEIMKDPVTLPTSGVVCDRASIARSLLSDEIDPFNRKYLTIEEVQPNQEMKEQIEKWKYMKKSANECKK